MRETYTLRTMSIYDEPNYKLAKSLSIVTGRWPYQTYGQSFILVAIIWIAFTLQAVPQTLAIILHFHDREVLLEAMAPYIIDIMFVAKYMNASYSAKLMKICFDKIKTDWTLLHNDEEKRILTYHANIGRLISTGYSGFAAVTTAIFIVEPIIPRIVNEITKSNVTIPLRFALPVEYVIFEKENYFWLMFTITNLFAINMIIVIIMCDVVFITCVQHVCGLFAVVGFRIESTPLGKVVKEEAKGKISSDASYKHLVSCIRSHRRALEFADLLEDTFSKSFGVVVALNLPMMSVTAMQIITQSNTVQQILKYLSFAFAQMLHLYFDCFMSQNLTDKSVRIQKCIANVKYYDLSIESQKLLLLMTMRSQIPCKVTAAKIMELSIENFGNMVKTSGSYFTMLMSMG
ncbi:odorant receptor 13a-like isoform X2 [Cotesia glomerata]|uniref:odorant receptor 13a-like isoform X2 n=1 Tax=Cotesia glomerata TaxID=32391 RepID=UPI001D0301DF|nr:odorant receptor 13a-like isoform X2 [Cotesia glomerata]